MECIKTLSGKVVIITGASAGIGACTAVEFAKLGCRLTLTGRNRDRLQATVDKCIGTGLNKTNLISVIGDMKKEADIKSVVDATIKAFGTVHVLVNNAGAVTDGNITNAPITMLDDMFNLHVRSVYIMTQLSLDHLKENKGSIVNVSSLASTRPVSDDTGYSVAKAAQDQLTRCMAQDLAPFGVRVNSVNPGYIRSDMAATLESVKDDADVEKFYRRMGTIHPLGRVGEVGEVARLIVFFASDAASFITGTNTPIDGGLSVTHRELQD